MDSIYNHANEAYPFSGEQTERTNKPDKVTKNYVADLLDQIYDHANQNYFNENE
mgnify:CR=1|jgi:hypothetical protein